MQVTKPSLFTSFLRYTMPSCPFGIRKTVGDMIFCAAGSRSISTTGSVQLSPSSDDQQPQMRASAWSLQSVSTYCVYAKRIRPSARRAKVDSPFRGLFSPVGRKSVSCPIFFIIKTPFHSRFSHLTGIFNISQAVLFFYFLRSYGFFRAHPL